MNRKWNEKTTLEKTMDIISGIALWIWLIFEFLEFKAVRYADTVTSILICIICVCQAVSYWNVKRAFSYVAIAGAILIAGTMLALAL